MASLLSSTQSLMKYIDGKEASSHIICLALIPKARLRKLQSVSLVKTDAKIVNQNLANQSQQYI